MKRSYSFFLLLIFILLSGEGKAQNWMMAKQYGMAAIDSILNSGQDDSDQFLFYGYSHCEYDPGKQQFTIYLVDSLGLSAFSSAHTKDSLTSYLDSDYAILTIGLNGGAGTIYDVIDDVYTVDLPDLSDQVFILNASSNKISFSLSCNDTDFTDFSIEAGTFNNYYCPSGYDLFIKITTLIDGTETGGVHYKLLKGKGYKVEFDPANRKFEVYTDDRIDAGT